MITYSGDIQGGRNRCGGFNVFRDDGRDRGLLFPAKSQLILNKSPDGFAWGYGGSGPAQLALAILLDVTGDKDIALKLYQAFKWAFVARWTSAWLITDDEIWDWYKLEER